MISAPPWTLRALQLFAAAVIALAIAVWLDLENPFWAAMPVWVIAQPNRQDMMLRAVLRVAGTLVGAAIGWLALTQLAEPGGRIAVLVAAVAVTTAHTYKIGRAYSYGVLMAGITVAVVLLPAFDHQIDGAGLALDRILCTIIGVVSVTAITFIFTPKRTVPPPHLHPAETRRVVLHGVIAGLTALIGALLAYLVGGPAGLGAGFALCIFSMLIASSRNPALILTYMPPGAAIGVIAAIAYRALDLALPDATGMALLLAIPFIACGALMRANPKTALLGLDANMCFLLAAEAGTAGHGFAAAWQGGVALVLSAFAFTFVFRHIGNVFARDER